MDLAAWAKPASPWEKNCRMNWCVSPAGTCPLPGPSQFFLPCLWGMGSGSSSSHIHPCPEVSPFPSPPYRRQRKGKGLGGQGSPSVLRLHRVFRLNQENFYYQKEEKKKKKEKNPSGHLSSLPHWDSQDWICGAPGRVAQGWNTLRQEWWGSLQALRQAHFGLPLSPLLSPPSDPPEVAFPCPQALGLWALYWGPVGVLHSPGEGERWYPGSLHTMSSARLPQSWALPPMSCCGDIRSPSQKSVPSSPTSPGGRRG